MATFIAGAVIVGAAALAVRSLWRDHRAGKSCGSCGGSCGKCRACHR